jgi:aspartate/methionine/tyrosine aminotransferase
MPLFQCPRELTQIAQSEIESLGDAPMGNLPLTPSHTDRKETTDMSELAPTYGKGRFLITLLTQPPFYNDEEILDLRDAATNGAGDSRIVATAEPAVNAISLLFKTRATEVSDQLAALGLERVEAGIGDSIDGPTAGEVLTAINDAGHPVFDVSALASAGVNVNDILHFEYGPMTGIPSVVAGIRPHLEAMLGFRVRDNVVQAHGGRADMALSLMAAREAMQVIWEQKRASAAATVETAKAAFDADPTNQALRRTWDKAAAYLTKFTHLKAAAVTKTWGTYRDIIEKVLGPDSFVGIDCEDDASDAPKNVRAACKADPNVGFIAFCNPNNPSSKQVPAHIMTDMCFVLFELELFCHEDDIYSSKCFKHQHRSLFLSAAILLANPETRKVAEWVACHSTMSVGWSKNGCSGLRHYVMLIPYLPLRKRVSGFMGALYGPANSLRRLSIFAMLRNGGHIRSWHSINRKRQALSDAMTYMDEQLAPWGVEVNWSGVEGGFYTWLRIKGIKGLNYVNRNGRTKVLDTGVQFGKFLIERAGLVISPDIAALTVDPEGVRISYGTMTVRTIGVMAKQVAAAIIALMQENGLSRAT